jgi:hypothetical protein
MDSARPDDAAFPPDPTSPAGPDDAGLVELYWNRPPGAVRRDAGQPPAAGRGPHLRRKRSSDLSDLWIDLGAGD